MQFPSQSSSEKRLIFEEAVGQKYNSEQTPPLQTEVENKNDETAHQKAVETLEKFLTTAQVSSEAAAAIWKTVKDLQSMEDKAADKVRIAYEAGVQKAAAIEYQFVFDLQQTKNVPNASLIAEQAVRKDFAFIADQLVFQNGTVTVRPQKPESTGEGKQEEQPRGFVDLGEEGRASRISELKAGLESKYEFAKGQLDKVIARSDDPIQQEMQLQFLRGGLEAGGNKNLLIGTLQLSGTGLNWMISLFDEGFNIASLRKREGQVAFLERVTKELPEEDQTVLIDHFVPPEFRVMAREILSSAKKAETEGGDVGKAIGESLEKFTKEIEPFFAALERVMKALEPILKRFQDMQQRLKDIMAGKDPDAAADKNFDAHIASKDPKRVKEQHDRLKIEKDTLDKEDFAKKPNLITERDGLNVKITSLETKVGKPDNYPSNDEGDKAKTRDKDNLAVYKLQRDELEAKIKDLEAKEARKKEVDRMYGIAEGVYKELEKAGVYKADTPDTTSPPSEDGTEVAATPAAEKPAKGTDASPNEPAGGPEIQALLKKNVASLQINSLHEYAADIHTSVSESGKTFVVERLQNSNQNTALYALHDTELGKILDDSKYAKLINPGVDQKAIFELTSNGWAALEKYAAGETAKVEETSENTPAVAPKASALEAPASAPDQQGATKSPSKEVAAESTRGPLSNNEKIALTDRLDAKIKNRIQLSSRSSIASYFENIEGKNTIIIYAANLSDEKLKSINDFLKDVPEGEKQPKDADGKIRIFPSEQTWKLLWNLVPEEKKA